VAIRLVDQRGGAGGNNLSEIDADLSEFCALAFSRFVKSRTLKTGISALRFQMTPILFILTAGKHLHLPDELDALVVTSQEGLKQELAQLNENVSEAIFEEGRSIIEGGKALAKPNATRRRQVVCTRRCSDPARARNHQFRRTPAPCRTLPCPRSSSSSRSSRIGKDGDPCYEGSSP
jgi:hypothetical protein